MSMSLSHSLQRALQAACLAGLVMASSPLAAQTPPGHPPVNHPPTSADIMQGLGQPLPDRSAPDPTIPRGTIEVEVRDENGRPFPGAQVRILTTHASIAEGNSETVQQKSTNQEGIAHFAGLEVSLRNSYAIAVERDGASYLVPAFRLAEKGHRAVIHTYPVTQNLQEAFVGMQALWSITLRSGHFQIQGLFRVMPLTRKTYAPKDVTVPLPEGARAVEVGEATGPGKLTWEDQYLQFAGTFPPGQNEVGYNFQIDRKNRDTQVIDLGVPPHSTNFVVLVEKTPNMSLSIPGFQIQETRNQEGKMMFVARRTMEPGQAPLSHVPVEIRGLPVIGPGRWYATSLALVISLGGLGFAFSRKKKTTGEAERDREQARQVLLDEMAVLEKAREADEIGPRTYEQTRREILLALSRLDAPAPN